MPMYIKMGLNGTGNLGHPTSHKRAAERYAGRRKIKSGYPVTTPFQTNEQIEEYLSGESITCLLCGHSKRTLGVHVKRIHGMTVEDYQRTYNIPFKYPLSCTETSELHSIDRKKQLSDPQVLADLLETAKLAREAMVKQPPRHRKLVPMVQESRTKRALSINKREAQWTTKDAEEFLRRISTGRTPREIQKDEDMPSLSWWGDYQRKNPEYNSRFNKIWDELPFEIQAKGEMLGVRFEYELRKLFDKGMSDKQAAKLLGVTTMTCNRRTQRWRNVK